MKQDVEIQNVAIRKESVAGAKAAFLEYKVRDQILNMK